MDVTINGETETLAAACNVAELLAARGLAHWAERAVSSLSQSRRLKLLMRSMLVSWSKKRQSINLFKHDIFLNKL